MNHLLVTKIWRLDSPPDVVQLSTGVAVAAKAKVGRLTRAPRLINLTLTLGLSPFLTTSAERILRTASHLSRRLYGLKM